MAVGTMDGGESGGSARAGSRLISLRVPEAMLESLQRHAARRAMPYQSLLKHWLAERLEEEGDRQALRQASAEPPAERAAP